MIQSNTLIPTLSLAAGQFATVSVGFVSDKMLTGLVIRFNPGLYTVSGSPTATAFQINYPPSPGRYEFNKLNCKNYRAFLVVKDAYNFDIEYYFFATKNINGWLPDVTFLNSTALDVSDFTGGLGFYVRAGLEKATAYVPIEISSFCKLPATFVLRKPNGTIVNGYTPNEDLIIDISTNGTVSNNFYIGLIKDDAISNAVDIVPGIILNYGKVGSNIAPYLEVPSDCFLEGLGFSQSGNSSIGSVTLKGSCLQSDSTYKVYVVFYQDGKWSSCLSQAINQVNAAPSILPSFTSSFTDGWGNVTTKRCIKGLSNFQGFAMCVNFDKDDYNAKLVEAGISGTFDDHFFSCTAFIGNSVGSINGVPLGVTDNGLGGFCVSAYQSQRATSYVIFKLIMKFAGYLDFIFIPFEMVFDAPEIPVNVTVYDENGPVTELCDGGDYILSESFEGCSIKQSIEGSDYIYSELIDATTLDESQMPYDSLVCIKADCDDTVIDEEQECECPECPKATINIIEKHFTNAPDTFRISFEEGLVWAAAIVIDNGGTPTVLSYNGTGISDVIPFTDIGTESTTVEIQMNKDGCYYEYFKTFFVGGNNTINYDVQVEPSNFYQDCECPDVPPSCKNYAAFDIECDKDTQTVTIGLFKNLESPIESEYFLASFDGGLTFIPCPDAVTGYPNIFITYDVKFSDGCEPIHIEQVVECMMNIEYKNSRQIELSLDGLVLEIDITTDFNSTPSSDMLYVSKDAGKTFVEFDLLGAGYLPITLEGNEDIVAYTYTIFEDGFSDLQISVSESVSELVIENPSTPCTGYDDYDMSLTFDENNSTFIVNTVGDKNALKVSELLWTLNGGNPFDANNSGVPYYEPVVGEGMFIAGWKIKLDGCPEKILHAVGFGKGCISLCEDTTINVKYPDGPIQMCIVECCEDTYTIECIDHVLTVVGDLTDATITWTGPSGFTASGNDITVENNGEYFATINKPGCVGSASYLFVHANAGTPLDEEFDV